MNKIIASMIMAALLTIPLASAMPSCVNETYSTDILNIGHTDVPTLEPCAYGCNQNTGECNRANGYTGMEFTAWALVFVVAMAFLFTGIGRQSVATPIIAMVLFGALAFGAFSIEYISGNNIINYGTNIILVSLSVILMFMALISALYNGIIGADDDEPGN